MTKAVFLFFTKQKKNLLRFLMFLLVLFLLIFFGEYWYQVIKNIPLSSEPPANAELVTVVQVFDGDTFSAKINGVTEKIRIVGIDTPEVSGGYRDAECFGKEASVFTKALLSGKSVQLQTSRLGDKTDKYGRLLRYVVLDGKDVGEMLISKGYAESYKKFLHDRRNEYNQQEINAKNSKMGLWQKCFSSHK